MFRPTKKRLWTSATAGLLLAVAGAAFATLGVLPGFSATSWANPVAFDAPTWTLKREKLASAATDGPRVAVQAPGDNTVVLDNWNYTAIVRSRPVPSPHQ